MKDTEISSQSNKIKEQKNVNRIGFYAAILTTVLTVVTLSVVRPPISGPFCKGSCIEYPYTDIISRFPIDYIWMYTAILLTLAYLVLMVCIHRGASEEKKVFSQIGLSFALISTAILIVDYFIQISVVQPSLLNGETEGISILTQYNPHGIFIALEDLGYLIMSFSFLSIAPVFYKKGRLEHSISLIFIISFIFTISSLIFISIVYGIKREYIFECAVIIVDWLTLIINGTLLSIVFRRMSRS